MLNYPQIMNKMSNSNQRNYMPIMATALLVLAGIAGYLAFDRSQLAESNTHFREMVKEAEVIQADLQISYDEVNERLDNMKSDNVELNAMIEEQKAQLSKQKDKVNSLIWTEKKWKEAKTEIAALEKMGAKYLEEITTLRDENARLADANISLTEQKNVLSERVARTAEENEELIAKKVALENYTSELSKERDFLSEKVDIASVVKVDDLIAIGYKVGKDGDLAKRRYAKYVDKVSVCFTTDANLITDNEEEEFYLRIIDPLGETMAIEDLGSGVLVDSKDGKSVRYTTSGAIDYDNDEQKVCIDWQPSMRWAKGIYEVEIYNKGFKAGSGKFQLK